MSELTGDTCFATMDLCHGYWQMPLDTDSQECQSFITPDGVFTPTRVLHGQTNATAHFQAAIQKVCLPLRDKLLQWIDDLLFHCKSASELLSVLRLFFSLCRQHHLKLHAKKCKLFLKRVKWCGRLISEEGILLDPSRMSALTSMQAPATGADLQQLLCASNWMRTAIPEFTALIGPLASALEEVYKFCGKRTRKAVQKVPLSEITWGPEQLSAFSRLKEALREAVTLAHPDPAKLLCLFTDASDNHWSGVLSQIPKVDKDLPFADQRHEPLSFLAGSFKGSSARWSTPEKEAFAIIDSVRRLDYMLLRPEGFLLYTDHKNLVFIFNPISTNTHLSKHVLNKIERWSILMTGFRYTIVHIPGEENVWADLLTRWAAPIASTALPSGSLSALFQAPLAPDLDPDFKWPSRSELIQLQNSALEEGSNAPESRNCNGLFVFNDDSIWIPNSAVQLQLRLCIIGHCGRGGHRGAATTYENIRAHFQWESMRSDIVSFCNTCLHCQSTTGGQRIPRPMGHALHSDRPNEIIHFDYLYMGPSDQGMQYVLIIKDDASAFVWLEPCTATDAESTVEVLLRWFASFGVVQTWISDRGSHFKNSVVNAVNRQLHSHHHFTTPNCPQSNGTVETVCKEVLRATRALLSEFRLKESEWPSVIRVIQSILNHSVRPSLGNRAPITVFCGLPSDNPLRTLLGSEVQGTATLDFVNAQRIIRAEKLSKSLDAIHREVAQNRTRRRQAAVKAHNDRTAVQAANFTVGDFVLVAQRTAKDGHKLRLRWRGPRRVTRVESEYIYEVQDLLTEQHSLVHANRLKLYSDSHLNVTEELKDSIDHNNPRLNTVTKLLDLRFNQQSEQYEVQAQWRGFSYEEPTWEPFKIMQEDIPKMLNTFLAKFPNKDLVQRALDS